MDSGPDVARSADAAVLCREGAALVERGRMEEALERFLTGARLFPTEPVFPENAAVVLHEMRRYREAVRLMGAAIERAPAEAELYARLGTWLQELGQPDTAAKLVEQAAALEPDVAARHLLVGTTYLRLQDGRAAAAALERALALDPDLLEAHAVLGVLRSAQGRRADSEAHFHRAIELRPTCGLPYYHLARAGSFTDAARLETLLADPAASHGDRSRMHFALGFLYDRRGEHDRAFAHFASGNALEEHGYDPHAHTAVVREIAATFTRALLDAHRGSGDAEATPVFIVGLPRSGSTLVEELLAAHPRVHAIGEHALGIPRLLRRLPSYVPDAPGGVFPGGVAHLSRDGIARMARDYLASIAPAPPPDAVVVDKMLENYLSLGLIELLFPRARILHCRRHPIDTSFSAFCLCFARQDIPWSYDLEHLARRHEDYSFLMEHWSRTSDLEILDVVYEELVSDPEAWTARLLAFCGLEREGNGPAPAAAPRVVFTSSAEQVRAKIHTRSCGRWVPYARHLGPLLRLG